MRYRPWILAAALLVAVLPVAGTAVGDASGCKVTTSPAVAVDRFYMYGTAREFWEEANGIPGLQRSSSWCPHGPSIPADVCITHSENGALINCALTYGPL